MSEVPEGWVQETVMDVAEWGDKVLGDRPPFLLSSEMPPGPERDERLRAVERARQRMAHIPPS